MPFLIALGPGRDDPDTWPDVVDAYPVRRSTADRLRAAALADAHTEGMDGWHAQALRIGWLWWLALHVDHLRRFHRLPTAGRLLAARERKA